MRRWRTAHNAARRRQARSSRAVRGLGIASRWAARWPYSFTIECNPKPVLIGMDWSSGSDRCEWVVWGEQGWKPATPELAELRGVRKIMGRDA